MRSEASLQRDVIFNLETQVSALKAELEEARRQRVSLWTCEQCAFSMSDEHFDGDGTYHCPNCAEERLTAELKAAEARAKLLDAENYGLKNEVDRLRARATAAEARAGGLAECIERATDILSLAEHGGDCDPEDDWCECIIDSVLSALEWTASPAQPATPREEGPKAEFGLACVECERDIAELRKGDIASKCDECEPTPRVDPFETPKGAPVTGKASNLEQASHVEPLVKGREAQPNVDAIEAERTDELKAAQAEAKRYREALEKIWRSAPTECSEIARAALNPNGGTTE